MADYILENSEDKPVLVSEPTEIMDELSEDVLPIGADETTIVSRPAFKVTDISEDVQAEANECRSLSDAGEAKSHELSSVLLNAGKTTEREGNCYCGKDRNMNIVELFCATCLRWFHESCISYQLGKLVPFMMNYVFLCKNCSPTGLESFKKNQAQFTQMCITTIANLMQNSTKEGTSRQYFSRDREIVPYIDSHWEYLTTMPRRVTQSWHSTIQKTLMKEKGLIFVCQEPVPETMASDCMFGLLSLELVNIRPNYEAMVRAGHLKQTDTTGGNTGIRGRGYKRRVPEQFGGNQRKTRNDLGTPKLPAHGYPLDHPFNKDGYRYILAEPDPHAPFRQEFDESSDWAGKPIPGWLYRKLNPSQVLLTLHDRAPQIKVTEDRMAATGEKGYCTIRATHYVNRGTWYWECTIEEMPESAATRIGFAQAYGNLQAPLGYDKFGYSWRSRKGTVFHESMGKHFSQGYCEGDTLGILIELPDIPSGNYIPPTYKDKPLVKFKSHLYYEDRDEVQEELRNLKPLKGAKIDFYKNGIHQGTGFQDIYAGNYFPALSLFKNVTVSVNFGPNFKFAPKDVAFRGMHERAEESIAEQAMADMLYLTENEGRLRLDNFGM
ncbi:set1/Ash2 histone methyltransferase complex subunit ASH2 isoform X2 [Daphnia magna]|uniref:set1/Ash2 histone methyltransferase complex subunit ASH2 isoform X2 n=1 Tax=Daphnia magna TaxID=35525 RepID=UPI0014020A7D|nr:set1/Ash2 histone methyltransferase complex subunit ASH2 isoform X2 [Daphnia magna]